MAMGCFLVMLSAIAQPSRFSDKVYLLVPYAKNIVSQGAVQKLVAHTIHATILLGQNINLFKHNKHLCMLLKDESSLFLKGHLQPI